MNWGKPPARKADLDTCLIARAALGFFRHPVSAKSLGPEHGKFLSLNGHRANNFFLGPTWVHWLPKTIQNDGTTRRTNLNGTTG
jgi:hypothetical protein